MVVDAADFEASLATDGALSHKHFYTYSTHVYRARVLNVGLDVPAGPGK